MNTQKKIRLIKNSSANSEHVHTRRDQSGAVSNSVGVQLIRIKPSGLLLSIVLSLHFIAMAAIFVSRFEFWILLLGAATLFVHGYVYYTHWRRLPAYRLQQSQDGHWFLYSEQDRADFLAIKRCYYWSRYLVIFHTQSSQGKSIFFPVFPDSCLNRSCLNKNGSSGSSFRHVRIVARYFL